MKRVPSLAASCILVASLISVLSQGAEDSGFGALGSREDDCAAYEYRCKDGSCVTSAYLCAPVDEGKTSEGCFFSVPVKCIGEERCVRLSEQCDGFCDCSNCSDEDPTRCHMVHPGDVPEDAKFFPTSTLLIAGFVFVMWSVYAYFKRKIRAARNRNRAAFHVEDAPSDSLVRTGVVRAFPLTTDQSVQSTPARAAHTSSTIDNATPSSGNSTRSFNDAPPSYTEAVANTQYDQQCSLLPPQDSIPPPPSYDAATGNVPQNANSSS